MTSQLKQLLTCKCLIVHGAGSVSKHILPYLISEKDIVIKGLSVSETKDTDKKINGIQVYKINDLVSYAKDATVLVATSDRYHAEIMKSLQKLNFENIIPLTQDLRDEVIEYCCGKFLVTHGVDLTSEFISIGNVRFKNPAFSKIPNSDNILNQISELVVPPVMQDYQMVVEGPYEYENVFLRSGDIVFDCGANMGVFSAYAASRQCNVFAFEPLEELNDLIKWQIGLNGTGDVFPFAVSDHDGLANLYENQYNIGGSSIMTTSSGKSRMVPCRSIDSIVSEFNLKSVDFIKADIEGAERLMLDGAKETLKQFAPKLAICTYHLSDDPTVLEEKIRRYNPNYQIAHRWEKLYAWVSS